MTKIDNYLHSLAIDFYPYHGELTGKDIANCFYQIVIHYTMEEKIMGMTVNNASANEKFIVELRALLHTFASVNQHFRCVAHISSLAVLDMLKISKIDDVDNQNEENKEENEENSCEDQEESEEIEDIESMPATSPLSKL